MCQVGGLSIHPPGWRGLTSLPWATFPIWLLSPSASSTLNVLCRSPDAPVAPIQLGTTIQEPRDRSWRSNCFFASGSAARTGVSGVPPAR